MSDSKTAHPHYHHAIRQMADQIKGVEDARFLQQITALMDIGASLGKPPVGFEHPPCFSEVGRHPRQCLDWLLSQLDFTDDALDNLNSSWCSDAISSAYTYQKGLGDVGLTFSAEEVTLYARLETLSDLLDLMGEALDWKALKRYLQGSYDDDISKGKLPFALTKGARFDDD